MKFCTLLSLILALITFSAVPAMADPTVTSPYNGSTVSSPFTLTATASSCSSQTVTAMGFSLDTSAANTIVNGGYVQQSVSASTGGHTLHVKAWGNKGAVCVTDVSITVNPASASSGPSVSAPLYGASVASPFNLSASHASCGGQPVLSMGYSLDISPSTTIVSGTTLNASVSAAAGGHTVHVKSWGNAGSACVTDVAVTVTGSSTVPANATTISHLQTLTNWTAIHDAGTVGTSSGWTGLAGSPSISGSARQFATSYTGYGGERYASSFSDNSSAHNFVYDGWVYIKDTALGAANIEMDLNQTIANGWTVIMGFQCDGWSGTWDYSTNQGSATKPAGHWMHTGAGCDPRKWSVNTWHHVQIGFYRDDSGYVTYQWVALDGAKANIGAKAFSGYALKWGLTVLTNFQVDGGTSYASGSNIYLDNFSVSYW